MNETPAKFKASLSLLDATMIVSGSMIGSGIFIVSADIARSLGSSGYLMLTWVLSALLTTLAALSYGELAGMMPRAGGQYVYLREAYNPLVGFLFGWTQFTVIQTGTIAAVAVAFAKFTAVFFPFFGTDNILLRLGFLNISAAQLLAITSVVLLSLWHTRGIQGGKLLQTSFTAAKLVALFGLIVLGFWIG
ncbi:MAG: amino acid permease, partial [Bacteroidetes bacterium]|nr:amino acid permease [Bacteroidota bacterium]